MPDMWDDDQLLALLQDAMRESREVPPSFTEAGRNAFAWRGIDAELAQLTYDSELDQDAAAGVRAEAASIRALTFTSPHLTIELEVGENTLLGQLVPTGEGTIEVLTRAGVTALIRVDEVGCFPVSPIPASPFRLRCRSADGSSVVTGWITL
jgi:hypothetical protein